MDLSEYDDEQLFDQLLRPRLNTQYGWDGILQGANARRVRSVLVERLQRVQNELSLRASSLHADVEALKRAGKDREAQQKEADYSAWRARTVKFVQLLQGRVAQAKRADKTYQVAQMQAQRTTDRREEREVLGQLAVAVATHQRACATAGIEPGEADLALWGTLDGLTVAFGADRATLSQMIDNFWFDPAPDTPAAD